RCSPAPAGGIPPAQLHAHAHAHAHVHVHASGEHLPFQLLHLTHDAMGISRHDSGGTPVVEGVSELRVATRHEQRVDADTRQAVVAAGALAALLRYRDVHRAFDRVVVHAGARLDSAADIGAGHHHAVVIIDLDPVVVLDAYPLGVSVVDPYR